MGEPRSSRPRPSGSTSAGRERGSALLLLPAGLLIMVVLGAVAVDTAVVHLRTREAVVVAQSAAQDAVTVGLDGEGFHRGEGYRIDAGRAQRVALEVVAASGLATDLRAPPRVEVDGDRVRVTLVVAVPAVFSPALPGGAGPATVTVEGEAVVTRR